MDSNKLSLTAKLACLEAFENTNFHVTPFYNLQVPEGRRGHPYLTDLLIHHAIEDTRNPITVHGKQLVMIISCGRT